jgi:mono/diheme cytochrome c family protein
MRTRSVLLVAWLLAITIPAFSQTLPPAVGRDVDFAKDVHAIIAENCASCHTKDQRKGALSLDSRENLLKGGDSGPGAIEGNSAESLLIKLVAGMDTERVMPPKGRRLTEQEIGILRAWIDQGIKWDLTAVPQDYVAPLKLQPVTPPEVPGETSANLIDRFIAADVVRRAARRSPRPWPTPRSRAAPTMTSPACRPRQRPSAASSPTPRPTSARS